MSCSCSNATAKRRQLGWIFMSYFALQFLVEVENEMLALDSNECVIFMYL